jgi:Xaa-Pro dipeptidase
MMLTD